MTDRFTLETGHRLSLAVIAALALVAVPARSAPAADKVAPVFDAGKVWPIHITLSAEEFAAIQPRGGLGFGPAPKEPAKPADPARAVHRGGDKGTRTVPWSRNPWADRRKPCRANPGRLPHGVAGSRTVTGRPRKSRALNVRSAAIP